MLIEVVYEFFVKFIFGGTLFINNAYVDFKPFTLVGRNSNGAPIGDSFISIRAFEYQAMDGTSRFITLGNYLSMLATIVSMVVILLLCCALIKKIYNMCAHIIG